MKEIKVRFEINGNIEMSGNIFIQEENNKGNFPFKTINEMREFYAKLNEKEQSENVSDK